MPEKDKNIVCAEQTLRHKARTTWKMMRQRCLNPEATGYSNYGGRGIACHAPWERFSCFLSDVGLPPSIDYTIDRIDNNAGYYPENVRWATRKEQQLNRRNSVIILYRGEKRNICEWAEFFNTCYIFVRRWVNTLCIKQSATVWLAPDFPAPYVPHTLTRTKKSDILPSPKKEKFIRAFQRRVSPETGKQQFLLNGNWVSRQRVYQVYQNKKE
jgi:hypothetical protein